MTEKRKPKFKLVSIQYLRAIAALMVVLYHTFHPNQTNFRNLAGDMFDFGSFGVDIFFTLSGFIMAYIIPTESNPATFLKKRMARIYPTYWQVYFSAIVLWIILRGIFGLKFMPHGSWFANLSLLPFEFDGRNVNMVLGVAWTLYYEVFFYAIIALILCFFSTPKWGMYAFFSIIFLAPDLLFGLQMTIFFEFIAGFLLLEFLKKPNPVDLAVMLVCVVALHHLEVREGGYIYTSFALVFLTVGFLLRNLELPEFKLLKKIGDSSYSLYLIHIPLIGIGNLICGNFSGSFSLLFTAFWLCFIMFLAHLNYEYFEKRIAAGLKLYNPFKSLMRFV